MQYITVKDYGKFQAFKDGRKVTWLKLLIEIIDQYDQSGEAKKYYSMPDSAKLTFVHLLCLQARFDKIPYENKKWLKSQLGISNVNLQPLVNAGFVIVSDSPVQSCTKPYKTVPEREKEREKERENSPNSIECELSQFLLNEILKRKPDFKQPNLQTWSKAIDLMLRRDNRKPEQIKKVIQWCQQDDFWQNNILSTEKLGKHFDKLELQMAGNTQGNQKLCVVCRKEGFKYQTSKKKNRRYLCESCYKAFCKVSKNGWGNLSLLDIARAVEQGKAKR